MGFQHFHLLYINCKDILLYFMRKSFFWAFQWYITLLVYVENLHKKSAKQNPRSGIPKCSSSVRPTNKKKDGGIKWVATNVRSNLQKTFFYWVKCKNKLIWSNLFGNTCITTSKYIFKIAQLFSWEVIFTGNDYQPRQFRFVCENVLRGKHVWFESFFSTYWVCYNVIM